MAVSSVAALVRESSNSLKSILASPDLSSDYQLVCTELSLQLLRIRLWAESVGIHIDEPGRGEHGIFDRPEVKRPITRAVNSIAILLTEIDVLRQDYGLKPTRQASTGLARNSSRFLQSRKSRSSIPPAPISPISESSSSSSSSIPEPQRQRSFLSQARWAMSDGKKFQDKVRKLKGLIDSLEDVSKSVAVGRSPQKRLPTRTRASSVESQQNQVLAPVQESPPPYTSPGSARRRGSSRPPQTIAGRRRSASRSYELTQRSNQQGEITAPIGNRPPSELPADSTIRRSASAPRPLSDSQFSEHFTTLKTYLTGIPAYAPRPSREKLFALSEIQLQEMRTDLYDELIRRQQPDGNDECLADNLNFRAKRNEARQRLAILRPHRFGHLVSDLVGEIERRSSDQPEEVEEPVSEISTALSPIRRRQSEAHHRHTSSLTPIVVPTWASSDEDDALPPTPPNPEKPIPTITTTPESPTAEGSNPPNQFVKSFHVGIHSPTSDILPIAMARYGIQGRWQQYSLYIRCGDQDRCLALEEKPLLVFKKLQKQGKKPVFMLKKRDAKALPVV